MSSTAIEPVLTPSVKNTDSHGVRVWFPIVLLSVYWGAVLFIHNTDMAMFPRFISRCVAWAITVLAFLGWWLFNRRINLRDRFAAVAWFIVVLVVAGILGHPTIILVLAIQGVPTLFTVCTIWLIVSRRWSKPARRIGFLAVLPLTLIPFEALRCEGIDGFQRTTVRWRWTQSAEEQFLASKPDAVLKPIAAGREWTVRPDDWPAFRGVNRDAVVTGVRLADDWSTQPPRLIWKQGRYGHGQLILLADQARLLIATESGEMVQVAARPDRFEELGRFQAIEGKLWNHPVIAEGSLFVRNGEEIACFELQAKPGK